MASDELGLTPLSVRITTDLQSRIEQYLADQQKQGQSMSMNAFMVRAAESLLTQYKASPGETQPLKSTEPDPSTQAMPDGVITPPPKGG